MIVQLGYLDTNLFVHNLYPNDQNYTRCREIITALEEGSAQGWIDRIIVYELTFILSRGCRFPNRSALAEYVRSIVTMAGVRAEDEALLISALDRWASLGVDFADAWVFVQAIASGQPVCTANARDFKGMVNTF